MRLVDYLEVIRQRRTLFGAIVVGVALAAVLAGLFQSPSYEATARLRVQPVAPWSDLSSFFEDDGGFVQGLATEAELLRGVAVAERVRADLGLEEPVDALIGRIRVEGVRDAAVLLVTATARDADVAQRIANGFADAYIEVRREQAVEAAEETSQRLNRRIESTQAELEQVDAEAAAAAGDPARAAALQARRDRLVGQLVALETNVEALEDREAIANGVGEVIQPASTARVTGESSLPRYLVLGLLTGAALGLGAVLLIDSFNESLRTKEDAEELTGAQVLGFVPWSESDVPLRDDPVSPEAEAYRLLRLNIERVLGSNGQRLLVTSPGSGDGKSVVALNLALAYAEADQGPLLVDLDLRRPRLHELLRVAGSPGLGEVLDGETPIGETIQQPTPRLLFVAAGEHRPASVDASIGAVDPAKLLAKLNRAATGAAGGADHRQRAPARGARRSPPLIVDAPPVFEAAEVSTMAGAVDGVLLVLRPGATGRQATLRAAEQIRRAGGEIVGVVMVGVHGGRELGLDRLGYGAGTPKVGAADQRGA